MNIGGKLENDAENEDASDNGLNDNDDKDLERGVGESVNEDYNDNNDNGNISKEELKACLYHSVNNMKVFELNLDADETLNNIDLLMC